MIKTHANSKFGFIYQYFQIMSSIYNFIKRRSPFIFYVHDNPWIWERPLYGALCIFLRLQQYIKGKIYFSKKYFLHSKQLYLFVYIYIVLNRIPWFKIIIGSVYLGILFIPNHVLHFAHPRLIGLPSIFSCLCKNSSAVSYLVNRWSDDAENLLKMDVAASSGI